MNTNQLPPEAQCWQSLPYLAQRTPTEFSAACPVCGDSGHLGRDAPDRFRIFTDNKPRAWCRKCGHFEWANKNEKVSPEIQQKWLQERLEREREKKKAIEKSIQLLEQQQSWYDYHNAIDNQAMNWWQNKGVPDYVVSTLYLGWCNTRTFWRNGTEFSTSTATIPIFAPEWSIRNIRHRLIDPIESNDKYRPERAGLPASLFYANPSKQPDGQCVIVEGEIKAIVVYDQLGGYNSNNAIAVVGVPGKAFNIEIIEPIKEQCDCIWIILDPDAKLQAWKLARQIGEAARVVELPCKADDLFVLYGGTKREFENALRYARRL